MLGGAHEEVIVDAVDAVLEADARDADPLRADEHLEQVVEACGRLVDDRGRAHHEILPDGLLRRSEMALVLHAGEVEIGEVAAVVHDPLRVRVGEADTFENGELERRHGGRLPEPMVRWHES